MIIHDILSNCNTKMQISCKFMLWNAASQKIRFQMVSADALTIFSGIIILFSQFWKICGFSRNCLFTGGVITESGSCRAGFLWKHSRGGVNVLLVFSGLNPLRSWHAAGVTERVLPASTSLSSTTPAHENGVQKHPQAFLDPKIKNIISLAYAQSNAERIQNRPTQQESAFCFTPSLAQSPQGLLPPRRR